MLEIFGKSDIGLTSIFTVLIKKPIRAVNVFIGFLLVFTVLPTHAAQNGQAQLNKMQTETASTSAEETDKKAFEKLLKFEIPATYNFYVKLPPDDQVRVMRTYNRNKKMSDARKLIFDLYFLRNKKSTSN